MTHSKWIYRGKPSEIPAELIAKYSRFHGIVYVAKLPDGIVKIGSTQTPKKRIQALRTTFKVFSERAIEEVAISQPCTDYLPLEKALHADFVGVRIRGELFSSSIDQVGVSLFGRPLVDESKSKEEDSRGFVESFKEEMGLNRGLERLKDLAREQDEESGSYFNRLCPIPRLITELSSLMTERVLVDFPSQLNPDTRLTAEEEETTFCLVRQLFSITAMKLMGPKSAFVEFSAPGEKDTLIDIVHDLDADLGECKIIEVLMTNPASE